MGVVFDTVNILSFAYTERVLKLSSFEKFRHLHQRNKINLMWK